MNPQTAKTGKQKLSSLFAVLPLVLAAACGQAPAQIPATGGEPVKAIEVCDAGAAGETGPATKLAFGTTPPSVAADGVPLSFFTVEVQDAEGRRISGDNTTVVTMQVEGTGAGFSGTLSKKVRAGRAVFDDLVPAGTGSATLRASASGLSASGAFGVEVGGAFALDSGTRSLGEGFLPALSRDGRYAAFHTGQIAVGKDAAQTWLADLASEGSALASSSVNDSFANGPSYFPSLSADGRYAVYVSDASDLVENDTNGVSDVFLYDRETGTVLRVDTDCAGDETPYGATAPAISASGRYVAFASAALSEFDENNVAALSLYVRDLATGDGFLVSAGLNDEPANDVSAGASLSDDGRYVAFLSAASNLVEGDTNGKWDVFVSDLKTQQTERVSLSSEGSEADGDNVFFLSRPAISGDGRYVAFASAASNLVEGDTNGRVDVFVRDREAGTTVRASVSSEGAESTGSSWYPSISSDGRFVAFSSDGTGLAPEDADSGSDVFVRDITAGRTLFVPSNGRDETADAALPVLSGDGRSLVFQQVASSVNSIEVTAILESF
ncbi:MAG: hypothetical protein AB1405_03915 [Bdellovibrionota bacterium]